MTEKKPKKLLEKIAEAFNDLDTQATQLQQRAAELEASGMAHATINWKDPEETVLRLSHYNDSPYRLAGGKRIEHIGKERERIAEAKDRVYRWNKWAEIQEELEKIKEKHLTAMQNLDMILYNIKAVQKPLPGFDTPKT